MFFKFKVKLESFKIIFKGELDKQTWKNVNFYKNKEYITNYL